MMETEMTRRILLLWAVAGVLVGCSSGERAQPKHYMMQGQIKSLDPAAKTANIDAGKIEGWMEAMTMDFPVKDEADFAKLHAGETIRATVFVQGLQYWVGNVQPESRGAAK